MRTGSCRLTTWRLLFSLGVAGLLLSACDSGGLAPDKALENGVAVSGTDNADVAAVATHRGGEWLVIRNGEPLEYPREAVYSTADGDRVTVRLDDDGEPVLAVADPYVLTFGKYEGTRVDVGLVNTATGTIETFDQIQPDLDVTMTEPSISDSVAAAPIPALETAGRGVAAVVCSIAAIPGLESPVTEDACNSSALLQVVTGATGRADWNQTEELLGWGPDTDECGGDFGPSCRDVLTEASERVVEDAQARIDENDREVARASAVVRFGGTWAYQDVDQSYFIIEKDLSYDISYSNFGSCYFIKRLELIGSDGNVFRYQTLSNENVLRLQFDRLSADQLTVTRLSDGREFEWESAPAQDLKSFLDGECGSSSTARATEIVR